MTRLLLDSHTALWLLTDSPRLGRGARTAIGAADAVLWSPVTPWELGIKASLRKLHLPGDVGAALTEAGVEELAITGRHAVTAVSLPPHHRDPFDRMLIAQANDAGAAIVTADAQLSDYDVAIVPASG